MVLSKKKTTKRQSLSSCLSSPFPKGVFFSDRRKKMKQKNEKKKREKKKNKKAPPRVPIVSLGILSRIKSSLCRIYQKKNQRETTHKKSARASKRKRERKGESRHVVAAPPTTRTSSPTTTTTTTMSARRRTMSMGSSCAFVRATKSRGTRGSAGGRRSAPSTVRVVSEGTGRFIVGGNWKCNGTRASVKELVETLNKNVPQIEKNCDVFCCPTFLHLPYVKENLDSRFSVCAQNSWVEADLVDPEHHYVRRPERLPGRFPLKCWKIWKCRSCYSATASRRFRRNG